MNRRMILSLALLFAMGVSSGCTFVPDPAYTVIHLEPAAGETDAEFQIRVRQAFNLVKPGTILEFGAGTYTFTAGLSVFASHVVVAGQGMDETILDFGSSDAAEGILVTGDQFEVRDLTVREPPGDGVKAVGVNGFIARRVRVLWQTLGSPDNGPYGIYPVLSQNILIEGCHVRGAEDAGIYVGQSANAMVRHNIVDDSVAGIEIENTIHADVQYNVTTRNAAGILVFDLTGLSQAGRSTRVHKNYVFDNNGPNFGSGVVALVPSGTGMLILATDDVEIFDNDVIDHKTVGIGVVSYVLTFLPFPPTFDAWPEQINVHDNRLTNNGFDAQGLVGQVVALQFAPDDVPSVMWDNTLNPALVEPDGYLPDALQFCVRNNTTDNAHAFGVMGVPPSGDRYETAPYDCAHAPVAEVVLPAPLPLPPGEEELSPEETAALCGAVTAGPNWDAFEANCPNLSDYNLFVGNDPRGPVTDRGLEYDLTTPLFSDYANKYRFVFVPPGEAAAYDPDDVFDMPVGTIISKSFGFDLVGGGEQMVETRLLIRRDTGWRSLVYLWDDTFTTATYTPEGAIKEVTFLHPDGNPRTIDYGVPDVNQCSGCHEGLPDPMNIIGPKARLLNRPIPGDPLGPNQLVQWESAGILTGLPADLSTVDRLPVWDDPADGTLGERARAYLESNCGHCHRPAGRAGFTSLWLDIDTPEGFNLGFCKTPIAAGAGSGGLDFDIVPGDASQSILAFRMDSAEPGVEMPELAKAIVHDAGVTLVSDWIDSLAGGCVLE